MFDDGLDEPGLQPQHVSRHSREDLAGHQRVGEELADVSPHGRVRVRDRALGEHGVVASGAIRERAAERRGGEQAGAALRVMHDRDVRPDPEPHGSRSAGRASRRSW
ncbi:hypothetical protein ABZ608_16715 [Streptomyces sp. NPDC013172]|uniref:hypothetical protein n=1 Tax=Streptomyces sp. NPDC013172 TaxID=3155009 RepID=UPI0033CAE762